MPVCDDVADIDDDAGAPLESPRRSSVSVGRLGKERSACIDTTSETTYDAVRMEALGLSISIALDSLQNSSASIKPNPRKTNDLSEPFPFGRCGSPTGRFAPFEDVETTAAGAAGRAEAATIGVGAGVDATTTGAGRAGAAAEDCKASSALDRLYEERNARQWAWNVRGIAFVVYAEQLCIYPLSVSVGRSSIKE